MVFPSVPLYLDPSTSWNQQQHQLVHQQQPTGGGGNGNGDPRQQSQLQPVPAQQPPRPDGGGGSMGSIRPNSMADRARLAKIPQPEQALKCPRCDSTNTKFCYFNNYSLSQPRHFCKTCRRYWTRGGALRNVPVGGGCRRNKRNNKSGGGGSSKSSSAATTAENRQPGTGSSSSSATSAGTSTLPAAPPPPQLPFLGSLHPMMDYGAVPNIGLGFSGMQQSMDHHHHSVDNMGLEQWRLSQIQQFPFLGGLESQLPVAGMPGIYPFDGQGSSGGVAGAPTESELITQLASVKMKENNPRGLNLARQYLGVSTPRNVQFWAGVGGGGNGGEGSSAGAGGSDGGGGGWMTNLSGFNSSSTGSLL